MEFPEGLKYSKEHEWVLVEGNTATIGITEFAQEELGDIVYVELPEVGERNCDWSYGSLVCQRTNFIELKVSATSHEGAERC